MTLATTRAIDGTNHQYTLREGDQVYGPYPGCTAITGLQDSIGGSDGLTYWAVNLALDEVERNTDNLGDWAVVRRLAQAAPKGPANLGTAVHDAVDKLNRGQFPPVDARTAPYVAQYGAALYQQGIRILGSERWVINTTVGFGGKYDSLVEINGERGILDVKSGKEKPSMKLQLTGLSMGEYHGEAGLEAEPMPKLSGVGFILLLKPDRYDLIRHEITDEDREHFVALVETYHRIREWSAAYLPPAARKEAA